MPNRTRRPAAPARDPALEARLAKEFGETLRGDLRAFARVPSTMDIAHTIPQEGALVWAARQEQGRGRRGRTWESPEGGAYFSITVQPTRSAAEIPQLALVAGLAAAEAIRECAVLSPRVRWPNDLLINGKKIAGILCEGTGDRGQGTEKNNTCVVIGIGINVATKDVDLPETATSLTAAGGKNLEPFHLTARVYRRFFRWYDVWAKDGFAPIREALRPQMALFGEVVHIKTGQATGKNGEFEGQALDIDEQGRLVVRLDSGITRQFEMGEVTLLQ